MPGLTFRWHTMVQDGADLKSQGCAPYKYHGRTSYDEHGHLFITLVSDFVTKKFGSYRKLAIISVLAHEAVHAFLNQYSCFFCGTLNSNVVAFGGHGRAWQLLALQLKESFAALIGVPLELYRCDSLICNIQEGDTPPTLHDLEYYKLRNQFVASADREGYGDEDVYELAKNTLAKYHSSWPLGYINEAGQPTPEDKEEDIDPIVPDASLHTSNCRGTCDTDKYRWFIGAVPSLLLIGAVFWIDAVVIFSLWFMGIVPSSLLIGTVLWTSALVILPLYYISIAIGQM
jgi:hypothetical protein